MTFTKTAASFLGLAATLSSLAACEVRKLQTITQPTPTTADLLTQPTMDGLVAHWSCDESDGSSFLYDTSGNKHDGRVTGATFTAGQFGKALSLKLGQYVTVPDFPELAASSWSVSLWIRTQSAYDNGENAVLITNEISSIGGWAITASDTQFHFRFDAGPDSGTAVYATYDCPCFAYDRWVHLVLVVDREAMTMTFYSDGSRRDSAPIQQPIRAGAPDLLIGRGAIDQFYAGQIDDIAIYSRALSPGDVYLLYTAAVHDLAVRPLDVFPPTTPDVRAGSPDAAQSMD
jgi:hypothetical protein